MDGRLSWSILCLSFGLVNVAAGMQDGTRAELSQAFDEIGAGVKRLERIVEGESCPDRKSNKVFLNKTIKVSEDMRGFFLTSNDENQLKDLLPLLKKLQFGIQQKIAQLDDAIDDKLWDDLEKRFQACRFRDRNEAIDEIVKLNNEIKTQIIITKELIAESSLTYTEKGKRQNLLKKLGGRAKYAVAPLLEWKGGKVPLKQAQDILDDLRNISGFVDGVADSLYGIK